MRRITISVFVLFALTIALSYAVSVTRASRSGTLASNIAAVSVTVNTNPALDGFDPNANGLVRTAVVQPDGRILIGGDFTALAPNGGGSVTRNYIARLNTDGTVDPTFNPNANSSIQAIALQSDGKILLGGDFSAFAPNGGASVNRTFIGRLNADGTVDTNFDPRANSPVRAVTVQADGDILIGGDFTALAPGGGASVTRNRVARLHANGTVDTIFDPNASTTVEELAVQTDGRILLGGRFNTLAPNGGATVTRNFVARVNVDGTLDASFDPNPNSIPGAIAVQPDGKILVGGAFTALAPRGGASIARDHLVRLNGDGTIDNTFSPNPNSFIRVIALQANGKILIGGGFTSLAPNGGTSVFNKYLARLNADGTIDTGVNPAPNDQVFTIAVQSDGKFVVGGAFYSTNSFGGQTRDRIARLEADGRIDQTLNLNAVGSVVYAAAVQPDGKIVIGGVFSNIQGATRNNIARLNTDGTVDTSFSPGTNGTIETINIQADGKIVVGGLFTSITASGGPSVTRNHVGRFNADGTVDLTFNPNADDYIYTLALQADGKILLGGPFTALAPNGGPSVTRNHIARVNTDGSLDQGFNPNADGIVATIALQSDGKILTGGGFTTIAPNNGASVNRNYIARLNTDGTVDMAFDPKASDRVAVIAVQPDGKSIVGGFFNAFAPNGGSSVTRNHIARLNTDGSLDEAFNPNADGIVVTLALQSDGKILTSGGFTTLTPDNGTSVIRHWMARLNSDGTVDPVFDPAPTDAVFALTLQADGKILAGGQFGSIGGQSRSLFARLANDTPAIQNLVVTPATVTWERSGAAPQMARVTFEWSTDGINYTFLGNGTRIGTSSDFTLAGLALSVQQNLYVRARGFYGGGISPDAASSINDSVRYVFLPPAWHLAFGQQPTNASAGMAINPAVTVQIFDASNTQLDSNAAVTIAIGTNPSGGTLSGIRTVAAVNGTATFNNLSIDKIDAGYTLTASGTNLAGAISNPFNITAGAPSSIVATAGSGQSATIGSTFANALRATVTDASGTPVSGVTVNFVAPGSGASGTFANNTTATTASTNASGVATASTFTASGAAGSYTVVASINTGSPSTTFSLTNTRANQTISVTTHAPANAVYNAQFSVNAVSSSGLPVSYSSAGSCTNNGATFTISDGTGTCTVKYDQSGGTNYAAAPQVTEVVTAQKAAQTITFGALTDKTFGDSDFVVNASATSGLNVAFAASGNCGVSGTTVHINGAGSCTITASQSGSSAYNAAPNVARSFNIAKGSQTISFGALANKTFGDPDFAVSASSSSGLAVSFAVTGQCAMSGSMVHLTGAGSCSITASQSGDSNYNAAADVQRSFQIAKRSQNITFESLSDKAFGDADFSVSASASSGLPVSLAASGSCAISGSNVHINGVGSCSITASQSGNSNYDAATDVASSFNIAKAGQTISFGSLSNRTFGDSDFAVSATATSGLAVSFAAAGQCTVAGSQVHLVGAGSCTVTASQGGDSNYNAATEVQRSFQIAKAGQAITFDAIASHVFGDADFALNAMATSGLSINFAASGNCTINGSSVHITGAGSCTVTASQGGDSNHNAATEVQRSFQIAKAGQTITFDAIGDRVFGDPDLQVSASATSGRPVTLAASGQCTNTGSSVHISGAGSCSVTASAGGDANYQAATDVTRSFQIAKASTTTALVSAGSSSSMTFTAAVTSGVGVPGGTVNFKYDGGAITSCSDVALQSGSASCVTQLASTGSHTITAEYSGEPNFKPSTGTLTVEASGGSTFEFSQAVYNVAERGGFVTITVHRNGDATAPASVDYATEDGSIPSVAVPCSLAAGFALERCDYTRAAGTLEFAANETEKSFIVLVNDDSYVESTETTSLTLSNPGAGAALGPRSTATLQITDDLTESLGNPVDDIAPFVRQHYHDFLNREPDSDGLKFWTSNIAECDTEGCAEVKRVDTSAAFFLSIEFQETGYLVERFYKAAYGDAVGASTFDGSHQLAVPIIRWREFLHDTQEIGNGVIVGQAAWQQQLEDHKQAFARKFISRGRFTSAYPASLSAAQFVNQLNANAGGVLSDAEVMQLEGLFGGPNASSSDARARARVLRTIAESQALQQREFNRAFVLMQYFGYLRRNPDDAQDRDYTGYDFWLQKLERFNGNYINAEMVKAFASSIEYRQRFGQ